jgi:hypothetical protein
MTWIPAFAGKTDERVGPEMPRPSPIEGEGRDLVRQFED